MTDPSDKKPKSKRSSFDVDLDAMLDEAELSLTPIPELLDEDAIDRLLVDDGFDLDDEFGAGTPDKQDPIMDDLPISDEGMAANRARPKAGKSRAGLVADKVVAADELDLKLEQASIELEATDNPVVADSPDSQSEQAEAPPEDVVDALDIMLAQASDELGLPADATDGSKVSAFPYELAEADDDAEEPELTDLASDPTEVADDADLLAIMQAQEADLAKELEVELEQSRLHEQALAASALVESPLASVEAEESENDAAQAETDASLDDLDLGQEAAEASAEQIADLADLEVEEEQALADDLAALDEFIGEDGVTEPEADNFADELEAEEQTEEAVLPTDNIDFEDLEIELEQQLVDDIAEPEADEFADDVDPEAQTEEAVLPTDNIDFEDLEIELEQQIDDDIAAQEVDEFADDSDIVAQTVAEDTEPPTETIDFEDLQIEHEIPVADEFAGLMGDDDDGAEQGLDEFGDDFDMEALMKEAEAELADQIASELLSDDAGAQQPEQDATSNAFDDFNGLEIIGDDMDGIPGANEAEDEFASDEVEEVSSIAEDDFLLADFDIGSDAEDDEATAANIIEDADNPFADVDNPFGDDSPLFEEPLAAEADVEIEQLLAGTEPQAVKAAVEDGAGLAAFAEFKAEQENFNKQQKKLITDLESKSKKSVIFTYAALGFGVVALGIAGYLGVVAHSAKNEVGKLNEVIAGFDKKLAAMPVPVPEEAGATEALDALVPDQVDAEAGAETEAETPKVDGHEAAAHPGKTEKPAATDAHASKAKPPVDDAKSQEPEQNHDAPEATKDSHAQPETAQKPDKLAHKPKADAVDEKTDATSEHENPPKTSKTVAGKTEKPEALSKQTKLAEEPEPTIEPKKKLKQAEPEDSGAEKKPEKIAAATKVKPKKKPAKVEAEPKKEKPTPKKVVAAGDWSVNLIAFKQDWYAKGKASEFRQKGVPVEVLNVKINDANWYRLRVSGFNSQSEANAYAGRVKKALNLSSVWVSK